MKTKIQLRVFLTLIGISSVLAQSLIAAPPVISNVRALQRSGTQLVDIDFDVTDSDSDTFSISVAVSADGGTNYNVPAYTFAGAYGVGIGRGFNRITWNAGVDWPGRFSPQCKVRVTADDGSDPPALPGMTLVRSGTFMMGNSFPASEGDLDEAYSNSVPVSAFFIDMKEIDRDLWRNVVIFAVAHGYDLNPNVDWSPNHPVQSITWYDAVKWCNARSQRDNLTPVYYTDTNHTDPYLYKTGSVDLVNTYVKWNANGYRLPTEAEWENAARGGLMGNRYPWGNTINTNQANYDESGYASTVSVDSYTTNGYGLYNIVGNVSEWCWDWYDDFWYGREEARQADPHGPNDARTFRVFRGGSWGENSEHLRCAKRRFVAPWNSNGGLGFRCVKVAN